MTPFWIHKAVVLAIHDEQIAEHGGSPGTRDDSALESALGRPQNLAAYDEPDLCALAAAYAFGIARNHPFVDGNKRTSEVVSVTFLELNGLTVTADLADIVTTWLAIADGSMDEAQIADWFRSNTEPDTSELAPP